MAFVVVWKLSDVYFRVAGFLCHPVCLFTVVETTYELIYMLIVLVRALNSSPTNCLR